MQIHSFVGARTRRDGVLNGPDDVMPALLKRPGKRIQRVFGGMRFVIVDRSDSHGADQTPAATIASARIGTVVSFRPAIFRRESPTM